MQIGPTVLGLFFKHISQISFCAAYFYSNCLFMKVYRGFVSQRFTEDPAERRRVFLF
jgi:hypothetical protein